LLIWIVCFIILPSVIIDLYPSSMKYMVGDVNPTYYLCASVCSRNRVSRQDKMAKPRVLVTIPGFCVSPDIISTPLCDRI